MDESKNAPQKPEASEGKAEAEGLRERFADRQPQNFSPEYLSPNVNENQLGKKEVGNPDPQNPAHVGRMEPSAKELANADDKEEPAADKRREALHEKEASEPESKRPVRK